MAPEPFFWVRILHSHFAHTSQTLGQTPSGHGASVKFLQVPLHLTDTDWLEEEGKDNPT